MTIFMPKEKYDAFFFLSYPDVIPRVDIVTIISNLFVAHMLDVPKAALTFVERLTALNVMTARGTLEDSVNGAKAVLDAKNAQEVFSIQTSLSRAAVEKTLAYSRSVREIAAQTKKELLPGI